MPEIQYPGVSLDNECSSFNCFSYRLLMLHIPIKRKTICMCFKRFELVNATDKYRQGNNLRSFRIVVIKDSLMPIKGTFLHDHWPTRPRADR